MTLTQRDALIGIVLAACLVTSGFETRLVAREPDAQQTGETLKQLSLADLGNIEVTTASKEPEVLRQTPAAIYVLTQEDIQRSGATSIPDALRLVPGMQVSRSDSDHWAIGVRGFANQFSQSLLVLIDGRSVYTPLFGGVYWSVENVLLSDVDRIEVIRGPGGTIWGADAVNGVINIITKSAAQTQGVVATVGGGSTDHANVGVRFGGGNGHNLDYRVYATGFDRGAEFHTDGHDFDAWRMAQGGFRTDWTGTRDSLVVQGDFYKGRDGQAVGFAAFAPPSQVISYDPVDLSGGNLLARWRRGFSNGSDIQLQTYYDHTYLLGPQVGETRNTFDVDFVHHVKGVPRQTFLWGAGARVSPSTIVQTVPSLDFTSHDPASSVYSAFAQDEIAIVNKRLTVTVGSKFEHNNYTGFEIEPSARLLWTPNDNQSIWAAVTRAVRTPSEIEEDFRLSGFLQASPPTFIRINGDPDLESERLLGYEAGYRRMLTAQFYVDVSVYYNHHDNLISFGNPSVLVEKLPAPAHVLLALPYANGVEGLSRGFEIAPDWKPHRDWQLKGSYSYLYIDLKNKPGNSDTSSVTNYEGSSPSHQAFVQSIVTLPADWDFDQTVRYTSALPAQAVPSYVTFDLRLARQFRHGVGVSLTGQNLAQAHHLEFGQSPLPPVAVERSIYASLSWAR